MTFPTMTSVDTLHGRGDRYTAPSSIYKLQYSSETLKLHFSSVACAKICVGTQTPNSNQKRSNKVAVQTQTNRDA